MSQAVRRWLWRILRIGICAGALAWVLSQLSWQQVRDVWSASDKGTLLAALLIFLPVGFIQSVRFVWMLRAQSIRISFWESLKLSFTGNFFNLFVPAGAMGGDLVKAYYVAQHTTQKTEAITAVFLDRVIGLVSFLLLAIGACFLRFDDPQIRSVTSGLFVLLLVCAIGACVVYSRRLRTRLRLETLAAHLPAADQLRRIGKATLRLREHLPLALAALLATLVLQGFVLWSFAVAAEGLGMRADVVAYFVYLAVALVVAAIPISPGGLGTMEAAMLLFLAGGGYGTRAQVVLLAVTMRLIQFFWAIPGGGIYLSGACRPDPAKLAAMESQLAEASSSG